MENGSLKRKPMTGTDLLLTLLWNERGRGSPLRAFAGRRRRRSAFPLLKMSCAAILLFVLSPFGSVGGQDSPPVPTWPLPGYPNTDGGFRYPLWDGSSYLDSAPSTGAERLWDIGITGKGVSVAVLDTLFDVDHEAIRNSIIAGAAFCGVKPTLSDPESRLLYPSLMQDMGIRTTTNVVTGTP